MAAPTTPTTTEVASSIVAQIQLSISQTIPLLPKSFTRVLAKALAGVVVILYKYAGFMFLQMFVAYASNEETEVAGRTIRPLTELGRLFGVGDAVAATRAEMTATVQVLTQTGSLPAGSQLIYPATGVVYLTTAAVELDAASVTITVRASSDQDGNGGVGAIGNLEAGDILNFANPLANIAGTATIVASTVTGADAEETEDYRARILEYVQRKPQGGAYADYSAWAKTAAGILNVYPYTSDTPGEVDVYVEATVASSGSDDGIPTAPQLAAVAAAIEYTDEGLPSRRPANAGVNVLAISRVTVDVTVSGLDATDPGAAQTAIEEAVDEFLRSLEPYIVGLSALPRLDRITQASIGGIVHESAVAVGATFGSVTMSISSEELTAYTLGNGEKAKLGTITFI